MHVQMYGCVFTHFATHHFEDAMLASERTPCDGTTYMLKHVGHILSLMCIYFGACKLVI